MYIVSIYFGPRLIPWRMKLSLTSYIGRVNPRHPKPHADCDMRQLLSGSRSVRNRRLSYSVAAPCSEGAAELQIPPTLSKTPARSSIWRIRGFLTFLSRHVQEEIYIHACSSNVIYKSYSSGPCITHVETTGFTTL